MSNEQASERLVKVESVVVEHGRRLNEHWERMAEIERSSREGQGAIRADVQRDVAEVKLSMREGFDNIHATLNRLDERMPPRWVSVGFGGAVIAGVVASIMERV